MQQLLQIFTQLQANEWTKTREGEVKLGERVVIPEASDWQNSIRKSSAQYVLLGIPEDIGVRANGGVGGAHTAWEAAVKSLLNIQSTLKFTGEELFILGAFDFSDWIQQSQLMNETELRNLVSKIDDAVCAIVTFIIEQQKIPLVVGGGHNNSYPLLKASSNAFAHSVNCINLDAHSDYRKIEGRHSGNGFRYAKAEHYLQQYAIVGLHENYNSQSVLAEMEADISINFSFFEDIFVRSKMTFKEALTKAANHTATTVTGIELDLDCIENVLSSAQTPSGISASQARQYIHFCTQHTKPCYVHIAEGATKLNSGKEDNSTGKLIAYLLSDFIKGMKNKLTI